jgi:hypothetical protein
MLDWEYAGWHPECWEYIVTVLSRGLRDDWVTLCVPAFMDEYPVEAGWGIQFIRWFEFGPWD